MNAEQRRLIIRDLRDLAAAERADDADTWRAYMRGRIDGALANKDGPRANHLRRRYRQLCRVALRRRVAS